MIPQHDRSQTSQPPSLPPPLLVATPHSVAAFRRAVLGSPRLAVDTESNSLYAYRERVCLIQVSTQRADFLVDPLQLDGGADLGFLGSIFADSAIEKIFHAAEYDVMGLRRDFGFTFANIFDTMTAARILGWKSIGLGSILEAHFGVRVNKSHQRANWGQRPLPDVLVRYAQLDTHYLLPLRDELYRALERAGRLEEAREIFDEVCRAEWSGGGFDPDGFWHLNGARTLEPAALAVLRELYLYREGQAQRADVPVFKVIGDGTLVELAAARPRSTGELRRIRGMTEGQIRRHGNGVLGCVRRGLKAAPPKHPHRRNNNSDELVLRRFEALHTWRKERAAQRGVSSDVVMPRDVLWELAEVAPRTREQLAQIRALGPWRLKTYGDEMLQVLSSIDDH